MKSLRIPLTALALCALAAPSIAATAASQAKPLTYSQVVKVLGGGDDAKAKKALEGKTLSVKLMAGGPDSLVVKKGDGLYFVCESRAPGFKAGSVTAKITKFETTHEGDISLSLDKCGS